MVMNRPTGGGGILGGTAPVHQKTLLIRSTCILLARAQFVSQLCLPSTHWLLRPRHLASQRVYLNMQHNPSLHSSNGSIMLHIGTIKAPCWVAVSKSSLHDEAVLSWGDNKTLIYDLINSADRWGKWWAAHQYSKGSIAAPWPHRVWHSSHAEKNGMQPHSH